MNVAGKWKICSVEGYNDEYEKQWIDAEDILKDESTNNSYKLMMKSVFVFSEDGYINRLIPVPEEFSKEIIDKAIQDGEIELYEGSILADKHQYKVDGERILFKSLIQDHNEEPSWMEIPYEDGKLQFFMFRLEKTD